MDTRMNLGALASAAAFGLCLPVAARELPEGAMMYAGEQVEADLRVIAARCGSPAYEKVFYKQSRAFVAAGRVVEGKDPVEVEKTVTSLRRSPFVLVEAPADCPAQMEMLKDVQGRRGGLPAKRRS
jgi:hypothetical protein